MNPSKLSRATLVIALLAVALGGATFFSPSLLGGMSGYANYLVFASAGVALVFVGISALTGRNRAAAAAAAPATHPGLPLDDFDLEQPATEKLSKQEKKRLAEEAKFQKQAARDAAKAAKAAAKAARKGQLVDQGDLLDDQTTEGWLDSIREASLADAPAGTDYRIAPAPGTIYDLDDVPGFDTDPLEAFNAVPEPAYLAPEPVYTEPAYVEPVPAYAAPEPAYEPVYTEPAYVEPVPAYVAPEPAYEPTYVAPEPVYTAGASATADPMFSADEINDPVWLTAAYDDPTFNVPYAEEITEAPVQDEHQEPQEDPSTDYTTEAITEETPMSITDYTDTTPTYTPEPTVTGSFAERAAAVQTALNEAIDMVRREMTTLAAETQRADAARAAADARAEAAHSTVSRLEQEIQAIREQTARDVAATNARLTAMQDQLASLPDREAEINRLTSIIDEVEANLNDVLASQATIASTAATAERVRIAAKLRTARRLAEGNTELLTLLDTVMKDN